MDEREILDLLDHLLVRAGESDLADFDAPVADELDRFAGSPVRLLISYLEALDDELALRSRDTALTIVDRLNGSVLPKGQAVSGVKIEPGPVAALLDDEPVDLLEDLPDLTAQRRELRNLIQFVTAELDDEARG